MGLFSRKKDKEKVRFPSISFPIQSTSTIEFYPKSGNKKKYLRGKKNGELRFKNSKWGKKNDIFEK
jgi:hypothetical protein